MEKRKMMSIKSADIDEETGKFNGYLSTYENTDREGDIISRGAFDEGVAKKSTVPLLFNHRTSEVLGKLNLVTDARGLYADGVLNMADEKVKNIYNLLKMGALDSMSVGMFIKEYDPIDPEEPWRGWNIKKAEAFEGSIVAVPANERATIDFVKNLETNRSEDRVENKEKEVVKEGIFAKAFKNFKKEEPTEDEVKDKLLETTIAEVDELTKELAASKLANEALEARLKALEDKEKELESKEKEVESKEKELGQKEEDVEKKLESNEAEKEALLKRFGALGVDALEKALEDQKKEKQEFKLFDAFADDDEEENGDA